MLPCIGLSTIWISLWLFPIFLGIYPCEVRKVEWGCEIAPLRQMLEIECSRGSPLLINWLRFRISLIYNSICLWELRTFSYLCIALEIAQFTSVLKRETALLVPSYLHAISFNRQSAEPCLTWSTNHTLKQKLTCDCMLETEVVPVRAALESDVNLFLCGSQKGIPLNLSLKIAVKPYWSLWMERMCLLRCDACLKVLSQSWQA